MARKASVVSIDIRARTAGLHTDLDEAKGGFREFGASVRREVNEAKGAMALFSEEVGVKIPRHIRGFLAELPGVGAAFNAAFSSLAIVGTIDVLVEAGRKVIEFREKLVGLSEAPERMAQAFDELNRPIARANDELRVTNDRLDADIAKLQGKPGNGLVIALDEARVAADKLASSMDKDLTSLEKLLREQQAKGFESFFSESGGLKDIGDQIKEFHQEVNEITARVMTQVQPSTKPGLLGITLKPDVKGSDDAIREGIEELRQKYVAMVTNLQAQLPKPGQPGALALDAGVISNAIRGTISNLTEQYNSASEQLRNLLGTQRKTELEQRVKPEDPFGQALQRLRIERQTAEGQLAAARTGGDAAKLWEAYERGAGEAAKQIAEVNKQLQGQHRPLTTAAQDLQILQQAVRRYLAEYQTGVVEKQAGAMQGITREQDRLWQQLDEEQRKRNRTLTTLNDEINAARTLAAAETQGAEAVWHAQERIKLARIQDPQERTLTEQRDEAEHAGAIAKTVQQLDLEAAATQRLTAATLGGRDAQRAAEAENIRRSGQAQEIIDAQLKALNARYALEDAVNLRNMPASAGARAFFQDMVDNARSAAQNMRDILGGAFQNLNDNLVRLITGQKASWEGFFRGLAEQFARMGLSNLETELAGRMTDILRPRQTGANAPLEGGGVPGEGLGGILGHIGSILFGGSATGKRDGSSSGNALYVQPVGPSGSVLGTMTGGPGGIGSILDSLGFGGGQRGGFLSMGGLLNGLLTPSFSIGGSPLGEMAANASVQSTTLDDLVAGLGLAGLAGGGDVDPGEAYMVGEKGPELFTPATAGSITPHDRLGGTNVTYHIDARGSTNPAETTRQLKQALYAVHGSAVRSSTFVQSDIARRKPKGS